MVEIPDTLQSMFSAVVRSKDGTYTIEVPSSEVRHEAIRPGESYRIAVIESTGGPFQVDQKSASESVSKTVQPSDPPEPPVEEGEVLDVTIESVGDQGDGIAKVDRGYVLIVPDGQPGDEPTVRVEQVQENVAFTSIVDQDTRTL